MRAKYVEERFPRYFVFGESDVTCDVSDGESDVLRAIDHRSAHRLIADRNAAVDMLVKLALELASADVSRFDRAWYGDA